MSKPTFDPQALARLKAQHAPTDDSESVEERTESAWWSGLWGGIPVGFLLAVILCAWVL